MKKYGKQFGRILYLTAFCGWWGFLYPQLILPQGTYRITYTKEVEEDMFMGDSSVGDNSMGDDSMRDNSMEKLFMEELTGEDLLKELESSEENTICIKSRLWTWLQNYLWENDNE